jgi:tetratricopeptide (TPR) repeat protein
MTRKLVALFAGGILAAAGIFAAPQGAPPSDQAQGTHFNDLGTAYMNQQLFEKALKSFEEAAKADPQLVIARINQGVALIGLGKVDAAKLVLSAAAKENPKDPYAWYNLGLAAKNTSDIATAITAFQRVNDLDPGDADAWYFLGTVYSQNRQFSEAIQAFHHALQLNPLHSSAEFGLSRALQQSGDPNQAREHLQRFQHINESNVGKPISLAYGEQGKYSRAEESPAALRKVPDAIPVRFVSVTNEAGLSSKTAGAISGDITSLSGPGACFLDYDGDGKQDLFLADNGPQGGMALYHNLGNGKFEDVTTKAGLDPTQHGVGCTAGDYDNDGMTDLAVSLNGRVLLLHNEKNGTFKDVTEAAGIKSDGLNMGPTFIDYDHDGDIDLYVTRYNGNGAASSESFSGLLKQTSGEGANVMWRNNGNGTFTDVTKTVGLAVSDLVFGAVGTDYNNDRAVDLVVTGSPAIYENPREGAFPKREPWKGKAPGPAIGVSVLDFNHDGWMDLAFTHADPPVLTLWRNNQRQFEQVALPETNWVRAFGVAAFDYDDDGWVDLVAVGETAGGRGEVKLFRNLGPDGFKDVSSEVGLDKIELKNPRGIVTGDYDGDGATDLVITQNRGPAVLLRNDGGNKNHWLRLALKGLNDNKSGIGTKIEVFAGGNRQKFEIAGSSGFLGQNSSAINVGLGQSKDADVVRMLWPTGVLQDEIEVAGLREQDYTELDRRGSSCPTLFAWNGEHYALVGDMLGAGVVGHWIGPGLRNIPRATEYIKIERNALREKNGKLSFRFMEPLEEVVYLDQAKLLAVDHPASLEVYPNEYFASNPPYPAFNVVASRNATPPVAAHDEHGHDVLPDLRANRYFGDFEPLPYHGFAKMHSLELDLGERYHGGPLWLLMHGEVEYFSATSMYAAAQAGLEPIAPYVEALEASGKWVRVEDDMGFPAGGPRTMTADLTGKLPLGTQRIRISTNLQVYWNSILIDRTSQDQPIRLTTVPMSHADLRFHGFPLKIEGRPAGNVMYIYEKASATGPYTRPTGSYTRYGDVLPLLASFDDRLAVFGSGDEIALDFDPAKLPALEKGWVRDYFFVANGYEKDMDFYAAFGNTVDPLPFRGMAGYPYPKGKAFPLDASHFDYLLNYNTRYMSGDEQKGYAFDYGKK